MLNRWSPLYVNLCNPWTLHSTGQVGDFSKNRHSFGHLYLVLFIYDTTICTSHQVNEYIYTYKFLYVHHRWAKYFDFFESLTNPQDQYRQHHHKRTCYLYRGGSMPGQQTGSSGGKYNAERQKRAANGSTLRTDDCA